MHGLIRNALLAIAAALTFSGAAQAADAAASAPSAKVGPPAGFVAPPEPLPNENNAQRAKTQPGNNAPFWRGVRNSGDKPGISSLPGAEKGVLIQPFVQYPGSRMTNAGEAWRQVRNQWILPYGGALLVIVTLALLLFHWRKGPLGHEPNSGGAIERFTYFERAAHWSNAVAFCVLAVSLVVVFFTFVRDEFPRRGDWAWLRHMGGAINGNEVPSHRFNAGEKIIFWGGVLLLGVVIVSSGLVMDKVIPGLDYLRPDMQVAHMVHAVAAVLMMAMFLLHIYLGTFGMRGAYRAMRDGYVDEGWAREHHAMWLDDIQAGKIPAQRTVEPQPAPHAVRP